MDSSFRLCDALWGARRRVPSCQDVRLSFSTTPTWWSANDLESDEGLSASATTRTMNMASLNGKTALVTGASRGMGRASALALAAAGAQVLVHYGRGANEADGVVAEIRKAGGRAD